MLEWLDILGFCSETGVILDMGIFREATAINDSLERSV